MPTINYEYVDLGLPSGTLWAKYNIGATSETEYGNYYQYGKGADTYQVTSGQSNYSGTENPLAASADTAAQVWGGKWRMPTDTQITELITNTTYSFENNFNDSGINGGKFTASNGNYVFFPSAGYYNNGSLNEVGGCGRYWGSAPSGTTSAYRLVFCNEETYLSTRIRELGYPVRAVKSYGKVLTVSKYDGADVSTRVSTNSCDVNFELSGSDTSWITDVRIDSRTRRILSVKRNTNNYIERTAIIKPKINNVVCEDESKWIKVVQESGCECGTALSIPTPYVTLESGKTSSNYVYYNTGACFVSIDSFEYIPSTFINWYSASTEPQYGRILVQNRQTNTGVERSGTVIVNYSEAEGCTASTSFTVVMKTGCGCGCIYKYPSGQEETLTWYPNDTSTKGPGIVRYVPNPNSGYCYSSVTTSFTSDNASHWNVSGVTQYPDPSAPYDYWIPITPKYENNTTDDITGTFILEYTLREGTPGATCQFIVNCIHEGNSCISTFEWL
jgi:hypothetical protein